jgi:hypothetical protein
VEEASTLEAGPSEVSPWVVAYLEGLVACLVVAERILEEDPLAAGSCRLHEEDPPSLVEAPSVLRPTWQ